MLIKLLLLGAGFLILFACSLFAAAGNADKRIRQIEQKKNAKRYQH